MSQIQFKMKFSKLYPQFFFYACEQPRKETRGWEVSCPEGNANKALSLEWHYQDSRDSDTFSNDQVLAGGAADK